MNGQSDLSELVSNIIEEKHYSHCRLCLTCIKDENFAKFDDKVVWKNDEALPLSEVLEKLMDKEVTNEIPGIDAVCSNCINIVVNWLQFVNFCSESTLKLNKLIDNINSTLDTIDTSSLNRSLYILSNEEKTQIIFTQNDEQSKIDHMLPLNCNMCKKSFLNINEFKNHNQKHHSTFTCLKCSFTSSHDDQEHKNSNDFYKCNECPVFRCTEESLNIHINNCHSIHICVTCGKSCQGLSKLKIHEKKHHKYNSEGVLVCKECGKSCKGLEKLLAHEERHAAQKKQCPKCGKIYLTSEFYHKHVKLCLEDRIDHHPMRSRLKKPFTCDNCGKGYSTKSGLKVHIKYVHGNAVPHSCDQCGKQFTSQCYLKAHMITHTKEKNFPCDMCDRSFVTKEARLYHKRRHTGEKPYSCDMCEEKFVNSSARAEHIKYKHVGPTLSCELCSRKFVTKNNLRLHMNKHYDPFNKLYVGRSMIPPNMPGVQNMRLKLIEGTNKNFLINY